MSTFITTADLLDVGAPAVEILRTLKASGGPGRCAAVLAIALGRTCAHFDISLEQVTWVVREAYDVCKRDKR